MSRSRPFSLILAAVGLALPPGCGGDTSPTAPKTVLPSQDVPAGTVLSVKSGETERPVAGSSVTVAGRSYTSDTGGEVRLADPVGRGSLVDVVAAGFLDRQ